MKTTWIRRGSGLRLEFLGVGEAAEHVGVDGMVLGRRVDGERTGRHPMVTAVAGARVRRRGTRGGERLRGKRGSGEGLTVSL